MPRQHRHVVEEPLGRRVWLAQIELHRLLIQLAHRNRFAADREQIPVRRRDLFVEVHAKRKHHIVCIERVTVRELDPAPQGHGVLPAVRRGLPGLRQRGLGSLGFAVDVDEVRVHPADDVPGRSVDRGDGVERSRLGALNDDELATRAARFRPGDEKIRGGRRPLRSRDRSGRRCGEQERSDERADKQPVHQSARPLGAVHSFTASRLWRADGGHQPTRSTAEKLGSTQFQGGTSTSKKPAHDIG